MAEKKINKARKSKKSKKSKKTVTKAAAIRKGADVSWKSTGRGSTKKKNGKVIKFLDSGVDVRKHVPKRTLQSEIMTRHYASDHRRYLVKVERKDGTIHWFTPRAVTLEGQNRKAAA
jgi:hypothetical protein